MDTKVRFVRVPVTALLVMLVVGALASGCGVSKSKYLDVTKKSEDLQASLDAANKEKAELQTDKTGLEGQVKELQDTTAALNARLAETQKANQDIAQTYEGLVGSLKGELNSGKMQIEQMRDGISVNLAQDILFASGSANLDKEGKELLLKVSDQLKASPFQVLVTGHTDNQKIGPSLAKRYPTNWELGGARAATIVRLFEESGIPKERLAAVSFADGRPKQPNDTPEGRAKNRRIEIRLRPTTPDQVTSTSGSTGSN